MAAPVSTNPLRPFVATTTILLIVAAMYLARVVVVPVVLAALLAFLLTPLVSWMQRYRVPRVLAAVVTAALAFVFLGAVLVTVAFQLNDLATELPQHRTEILAKAENVHQVLSGERWQALTQIIDETIKTISPPKTTTSETGETIPATPAQATSAPGTPSWSPIMGWVFGPTLEAFIDAGIVMVLVVFMLSQHEDLRNRMIRLSGTRNVTSTTKALSDASRRVRRFLLHQFFINCCFGVIVTIGLWLIGVPYPLLWGLLGAALRYVPYIGTWMAAACPVLLSIALMEGWTGPLLTLGLFVLMDIVITNILEPIVYGRSIGVSGTALLIAAVFWTWLWGPLGLILSTPLTACVVVLGRHGANLEFLSILLSDEPPLSPALSFYQRLLARDEDEATTVVEEYIQKNGVENVYDHLLLPALVHTKETSQRGIMTDEDEEFVLSTTRRVLEDAVFPEQSLLEAKDAPPHGAEKERRLLVLGCPARDEVDETALRMLQRLLPEDKCKVEVLSKDALAGEVLTRIAEAHPAVLVIGAVPPYSVAAIRYLCKRVRSQFPDVKILVGCWGLKENVKETIDRLKAAGADMTSTELLETRSLLLPLLQDAQVVRAGEKPKASEMVRV